LPYWRAIQRQLEAGVIELERLGIDEEIGLRRITPALLGSCSGLCSALQA
jgi:hypothetical protein